MSHSIRSICFTHKKINFVESAPSFMLNCTLSKSVPYSNDNANFDLMLHCWVVVVRPSVKYMCWYFIKNPIEIFILWFYCVLILPQSRCWKLKLMLVDFGGSLLQVKLHFSFFPCQYTTEEQIFACGKIYWWSHWCIKETFLSIYESWWAG